MREGDNVNPGEYMFYAGIAVMACAAAAAIILLCIFKRRSNKLKNQLDKEYGPAGKR